ncbi:hypothetical protein [Actinopolymorpha pittospori]
MGKEFDSGKIDAAGSNLLKTAAQLDDQIDALLDATKRIGEPCGDAEPIGMLLGVSCAAAEEVLIQALESVVTCLEAHAQKLHVAAANYDNAELDNVGTVDGVVV